MITRGKIRLKLPSDDTRISSDLKLKWVANIISCKCGCGRTRLDRDSQGHKREYINGHQGHSHRGELASNWKGGRTKRRMYIMILKPDHPRADKDGYVGEHILKMEAKLGRYLKWYERVHHRDHNPSNNRLSNLQLTTIWEHKRLHRKDCGQICAKCGSKDVKRNGLHNSKQIFQCKLCRINWTVNNIIGIDFGQVCCNCGSKHVVRCGIKNNKQWFRCNDCRKYWRVPLQDLKEVVSDNDRQYRVANILGSR